MSKFIDKLKKVGQITSQPMGFAQHVSARAKNSNMLIIGLITSTDTSLAETAAKVGIDAVALISTAKIGKDTLQKLSDTLGEIPLGGTISAKEETTQDDDQYIDFNLIRDTQVPASQIQDIDKGTILTIDTTWSDSFIRSIDLMPLDAFLIDLSNKDTFTLELAINCQRVALLTQKPIIAYIQPSLGADIMPLLRDVGIKAIAVDVSESSKNGMLNQLCENARALEPKKRKPPERREALLPAATPAASSHVDEDEEDDD